jgi:hypothetical protein
MKVKQHTLDVAACGHLCADGRDPYRKVEGYEMWSCQSCNGVACDCGPCQYRKKHFTGE